MNKEILNIVGLFIGMLLLQVVFFNHIALFGVAFPFVFIYFILRQRINFNTNLLIFLSFLMGFIIDICNDTPGVNALGCTIIAFLKRPVLYMYIPRDDRTKEISPRINVIGVADYLKYTLTLSFIFSVIVFTAEYMRFVSIKEMIVMTVTSTLVSVLLILGIDSLFSINHDKKYE